jgi:hypothetical protein
MPSSSNSGQTARLLDVNLATRTLTLFAARTRQQEVRQELAQALELMKELKTSGQTELLAPAREHVQALKAQLATGRETIQSLRRAIAPVPNPEVEVAPIPESQSHVEPVATAAKVATPKPAAKAEIVALRTRQGEMRTELREAVELMRVLKAGEQPELAAPARERVQALKAQLASGRQAIKGFRLALVAAKAAEQDQADAEAEASPKDFNARPEIVMRRRQQDLRVEMAEARQALQQLRQSGTANEDTLTAARQRVQDLRTALGANHALLVAARGVTPQSAEFAAAKQQQQALREKAVETRGDIEAAKAAGADGKVIAALKEQHSALRDQLAQGREKLQILRCAKKAAETGQPEGVTEQEPSHKWTPRAGRRGLGRPAHWRVPVVVAAPVPASAAAPAPYPVPSAPAPEEMDSSPEAAPHCPGPHWCTDRAKKVHWKHAPGSFHAGPPHGKPGFAPAPGFTLTVEADCPPFTAHFVPFSGHPHGRKWAEVPFAARGRGPRGPGHHGPHGPHGHPHGPRGPHGPHGPHNRRGGWQFPQK